MTGEGGVKGNGQTPSERSVENTNKRPDRTPTKWVNFVSDAKYVREETPYRMYVFEPAFWEGEVVYAGQGETRVGRMTFDSNIIILQNGSTRYGFNLPKGSYYYVYLHNGDKVNEGDKVRITYLGFAGDFNLPTVNPNAHLIRIEVVN
jgi:hypothetical protein